MTKTKWITALCLIYTGNVFAADVEAPPKDAVPAPMAVFNFDRDAAGEPPQRFALAVTGDGPEIRWVVQDVSGSPSRPHALVQSGKASPGANFALAVLDGVKVDHGEAAVRFKTLGGEEPAAGLVFGYQDPQNYFVITASSKDDECALYRLKNGKLKKLDSQAVIIAPFTWHELRIVFAKKTYTALVNGEAVLGGKRTLLEAPGQIGLWTAADSSIAFDDLRVTK